jgi:hypothetical protein
MLVVTFRAKKCRNLSSAQHYDQIRFRFYTAWTHCGSRAPALAVLHNNSGSSTRFAENKIKHLRNWRPIPSATVFHWLEGKSDQSAQSDQSTRRLRPRLDRRD